MESRPEIIVKDGNFIRRTYVEHNLGPLSEVVTKAQKTTNVMIPDAFHIEHPSKLDYENDTYKEPVVVPVHLGRAGSTLYACHRLIYYPLYGYLNQEAAPDANGMQKLGWSGRHSTERVKRKVACDYPGLWVIYSFRLSNHKVSGFHNVYVVTNIRGKFYAPWIPNIYDNGKVCLGEIRAYFEGSVQKTVASLFNDLYTSESNDHLMGDKAFQLLKFEHTNKDGKMSSKWTPPDAFFNNPHEYHGKGRQSTIAADLLEKLIQIEETDASEKVK